MTVAIRNLTVPREHRLITQGQTVVIIVTVADVGIVSLLLDPSSAPLISLFDPLGLALVTDAAMTQLQTGLYLYRYQTSTANSLGVYTATVTAINGAEVARLDTVVVFKIIKASTLSTFSYLAIKDQADVVWYWYVATDNTLTPSPTPPAVAGKQAVQISSIVIPSWLQINNPTSAIRYVYPSLAGEPTVTATQPVVGSGQVGSPELSSISGGRFVIALDISDEVILNTV